MYYTIGQRRGLDVGGVKGDDGRWFVIEKDLKNNILYVAHGEEDKLYSKGLIMSGINFMPKMETEGSFECTAKFRYRQSEQKVTVHLLGDGTARVDFYERQRAITEGQYCVLYSGEYCLGGGVIEKALF
jgi:tRNA-specific 2-thiouridylase